MVLHIARWPIVFWAFVSCVLRMKHPYMITPKKTHDTLTSAVSRSISIYVVAAAACLAVVWRALLTDTPRSDGYMLFALLGAAYMLLVVVVNVTTDVSGLRGLGIGLARSMWIRATPLLITCCWVATLGLTSALAAPHIFDAITLIQGPAPACGDLCDFSLPSSLWR